MGSWGRAKEEGMRSMSEYYSDGLVTIYHGDSLEAELDNISAVVTDPPYELGFMGKKWDSTGVSYQAETWQKIRGFCLSGSPLLAFGGTRTFHRIACAIEDAGWEVRDTLMWVYGSGFPKSLDISKAIDKANGIEREDKFEASFERRAGPTGNKRCDVCGKWLVSGSPCQCPRPQDKPQSSMARLWEGYGTALKPAYEPILLCMNPLDGTFAENALKHKVAGLNIDGCRIPASSGDRFGGGGLNSPHCGFMAGTPNTYQRGMGFRDDTTKGRFPANFIHDGSQMVLELFPETTSGSRKGGDDFKKGRFEGEKGAWGLSVGGTCEGDNGSAARFFYCAKASKAERDRGCEDMPDSQEFDYLSDTLREGGERRVGRVSKNNHPTVKPLALMEYLVKLVKMPEYNLILDPFMGSGTTLLACIRLGIPCIGIDNDEHSCEIAAKRCQAFDV